MAKTKKILVRGANWVGDAVMTIPALRELRRVFPAARIALLTRRWARGIFEDADYIDEILPFEPSGAKAKDVFAQSKIIRGQGFDLAVLFPNSFESALAVKIGKIKHRFGYAKDARGFLLTDPIKIPEWKNERHEAFYYLNLIAAVERKHLGTETIGLSEPQTALPISEARKTEARSILKANGVDLQKTIIALGVGSTNSRAKRWGAESYAALNDKLQNELNASVVLVGADNEREVSAAVFEKSMRKPIVLTGETTLAEAAAILSEVDLLVSNDMGLAHLAPATGTKTLVIFGPTNELTTRPIGAEIIRRTVECAPCMLRDCPIDHRCMTRISVEEVFKKSIEILQK